MESSNDEAREVRAARNEALFRALNQNLKKLNDALSGESLSSVTETFTIACECPDEICIEMIEIRSDEYEAIRAEPRRFAVLPGHVYPNVERVIDKRRDYVVVEKFAIAGEVAEVIDLESRAI